MKFYLTLLKLKNIKIKLNTVETEEDQNSLGAFQWRTESLQRNEQLFRSY